jgi:hypothetical protein
LAEHTASAASAALAARQAPVAAIQLRFIEIFYSGSAL